MACKIKTSLPLSRDVSLIEKAYGAGVEVAVGSRVAEAASAEGVGAAAVPGSLTGDPAYTNGPFSGTSAGRPSGMSGRPIVDCPFGP